MKHSLFFFILLTLCACGNNNPIQQNLGPNQPKVLHYGALKNMMHKGDLSAKADLKDFKQAENFYALGAIENLKGEVQIFNSEPFNTQVLDDSLFFDHSLNKKAALLVQASVSKWVSIDIPNSVVGAEDLESFIAQSAMERGVDVNAPFPFLIEGTPKSFDWHVINWKDGDMEHSHEKHIRSGLYGTKENTPAEMLGFYSNAHHAIFTHHTTNMHIHVKTMDNTLAGHVDDLTLGKGMVLKLPDTR